MIRSFRSKALERFWWKGEARRVHPHHVDKLRRQLRALDLARTPEDMNIQGWRWHRLSGTEQDRFAVSVDQSWRLTFGWSADGPDAVDADYEDCQ